MPANESSISKIASLLCVVVVVACGGEEPSETAQTGTWQKVQSNELPELFHIGASFDEARNRAVLLAVSSQGTQTWELEDTRWTQIETRFTPADRFATTMVYDAARENTVLFGGLELNRSDIVADFWLYNGRSWSEITDIAMPPARLAGGMAYDSTRQKVVLFGGIGDRTLLFDTWEWDGQTWTEVVTEHVPTFVPYTMVYDESSQLTLAIVAGQNGTATWGYDGHDWRGLTKNPFLAVNAPAAFDRKKQRTVLFGGRTEKGCGSFSETWEFDGQNWTNTTPKPSPKNRWSHSMLYDPIREQTMVIGGWFSKPVAPLSEDCTLEPLLDTWTYEPSP